MADPPDPNAAQIVGDGMQSAIRIRDVTTTALAPLDVLNATLANLQATVANIEANMVSKADIEILRGDIRTFIQAS
jgi:hypothetical protein